MFCRDVFGNISGGSRGISRFLGGISLDFRENLNFAGQQLREISEALFIMVSTQCDVDPTSQTFAAQIVCK